MYIDEYNYWRDNSDLNAEMKNELIKIESNDEEIKECFGRHLDFGTGGLRAKMGVGINRINLYTIRRITSGLANYLLNNIDTPRVAISYDTRINSDFFAIETAKILAYHGIKTFLFKEYKPTPLLSYTIRHLGCSAGIMITASHNTSQYNGYKVYSSNGCQIVPPVDSEIVKCINEINDIFSVQTIDFDFAVDQGLIEFIPDSVEENYIDEIVKLRKDKELLLENNFSLVYSPLHGCSYSTVKLLFEKMGFLNAHIVEEQLYDGGKFGTVESPNPENKNAFIQAIGYATNNNSDLILLTDPDGDRVGVAIRNNQNEFQILNGNIVGAFLLEYLFSVKHKDSLEANKHKYKVITTIVSGKMADAIAEHYNIELKKTLTGFKFIGNQIDSIENEGDTFIFGFEESCGYLEEDIVRDKDAINAIALIVEASTYYTKIGVRLTDQIDHLYDKYGHYNEKLVSLTVDNNSQVDRFMGKVRSLDIKQIGSLKLINKVDYLNSNSLLMRSNVVYIELSDNNWICFRPSGTEPLIKVYFGSFSFDKNESALYFDQLQSFVNSLLNTL